MSRCWRLVLVVALLALVPFVLWPATADAQFSGIFDNGDNSGLDLDDDVDEMLRHLMPRMIVDTTAMVAPAPQSLRFGGRLAGPGPTLWPGRTPPGRAPPTGRAHHPTPSTSTDSPAFPISVGQLQPLSDQCPSAASKLVIPADRPAPSGFGTYASAWMSTLLPPTDHRF